MPATDDHTPAGAQMLNRLAPCRLLLLPARMMTILLNRQMTSRLLFLPGAAGAAAFWQPLQQLLAAGRQSVCYGWPGFGANPPDPAVGGLDDLVQQVLADVVAPSVLVAQSMGGIIALKVALENPHAISHLVLTATSGGIDIEGLGAQDWREAFAAANPAYPRWFIDCKEDLSARLHELQMPVLLLWADADPVSPVAVGEKLAGFLPRATLQVIAHAGHDLGRERADLLAPLIRKFLAQ